MAEAGELSTEGKILFGRTHEEADRNRCCYVADCGGYYRVAVHSVEIESCLGCGREEGLQLNSRSVVMP